MGAKSEMDPQLRCPTAVLAEVASLATTYGAGNIHFGAWLSKWEVRRAETHLGISPEHLSNEVIERLLEVGKRDILINIKAFALVEEAVRARRDRLIAVYPPRANDPHR